MFHKKSEQGQAIILIVFALIGLIGITGLTVDGGMAYSDRRHAQNAADSAAFAAALANSKNEDIEVAGQNIATANGYNDDGIQNEVVITYVASPAGTCPYEFANNKDINVEITSHINTYFAPIVGIKTMTNRVNANTRACGTYIAPIFGGNAIVSCGNTEENYCSFDSGQSGTATWTIHGGGIASDSCANAKTGSSVTLDPDQCVSGVTDITGSFSNICPGNAEPQCDETYLDSIFPKDPCVTPTPTDIDVIKVVHVDLDSMSAPYEFTDGIYCIDDMGNNMSGQDILIKNATLYIRDMDFALNFAGGGGFAGTPTESGTYSSYAIIVARNPIPCPGTSGIGSNTAQVMDYRGSSGGVLGTTGFYGTILAPTACIDMRGNAGQAEDLVINSQIIANKVSSNGNANIIINYIDDQNRREAVKPSIELIK